MFVPELPHCGSRLVYPWPPRFIHILFFLLTLIFIQFGTGSVYVSIRTFCYFGTHKYVLLCHFIVIFLFVIAISAVNVFFIYGCSFLSPLVAHHVFRPIGDRSAVFQSRAESCYCKARTPTRSPRKWWPPLWPSSKSWSSTLCFNSPRFVSIWLRSGPWERGPWVLSPTNNPSYSSVVFPPRVVKVTDVLQLLNFLGNILFLHHDCYANAVDAFQHNCNFKNSCLLWMI